LGGSDEITINGHNYSIYSSTLIRKKKLVKTLQEELFIIPDTEKFGGNKSTEAIVVEISRNSSNTLNHNIRTTLRKSMY